MHLEVMKKPDAVRVVFFDAGAGYTAALARAARPGVGEGDDGLLVLQIDAAGVTSPEQAEELARYLLLTAEITDVPRTVPERSRGGEGGPDG